MDAMMPPGMGPLPGYKRTAVLQRLSIQALVGVLPANRWLFRGEPGEDAGVDGELEVLFDANYANCRAKVQLKSTDSAETNKDGSVSLSVETSNLNYLLNGPSPLYIHYIAPREELRYAWAWDEFHRIESENADWREQGTITLRFVPILDGGALEKIHERIVRENFFKRQVTEAIERAGEAELTTLHVNPGTLEIVSPERVRDHLLKYGMSIVAGGRSPRVIELATLLGSTDLKLPQIQLTLAFARFAQSRLNAAYGHIQDAQLCHKDLTQNERDYLVYLRDACDVESGRITRDEYAARTEKWTETARSRFGLILRLESLSHELSYCNDTRHIPGLVKHIQSTVEGILSDGQSSDTQRLEAKVCLEHARGVQLLFRFLNEVNLGHIRASVGPHLDPSPRLQKFWTEYLAWDGGLDLLFQQALAKSNDRVLGNVAMTRALVRFMFLSDMRLVGLPHGLLEVPKDLLDRAMKSARVAADSYHLCGFLRGEMRAKMLLVDYLELAGLKDEAQELAREILPIAQVMGFEQVIECVTDQLEGKSHLSRIEEIVTRRRTLDDDDFLYAADEESVRDYAGAMMEALELPAERHPFVLEFCLSMREEARAKYYWCRHFQLIHDPRVDEREIARFERNPVILGACRIVKQAGGFYYTETLQVIEDFKQHVCSGCPHRDPKSGKP